MLQFLDDEQQTYQIRMNNSPSARWGLRPQAPIWVLAKFGDKRSSESLQGQNRGQFANFFEGFRSKKFRFSDFSRWFEDSSYVCAKFGVSSTSRSGLEFVYPISQTILQKVSSPVCTASYISHLLSWLISLFYFAVFAAFLHYHVYITNFDNRLTSSTAVSRVLLERIAKFKIELPGLVTEMHLCVCGVYEVNVSEVSY
ncbi:hypothetical protein J6590_091954 [Homalodisca vitripennis]|nr:hypothetical protein J6590_091954 [Homalodisca vitripennis]